MNTEKQKNKLAIWTVTRGAAQRGKDIQKILGGDLYALEKFSLEGVKAMGNFTKSLEENFSLYETHLFIMASGIVVRKIAPLLEGKDKDPAVLLVDEAYRFVISLLSGHLGRANERAEEFAKELGLLPIITTSSDITGKIAVDSLAQKLEGDLASLEAAKKVTALIVDGREVELRLPKNVSTETTNPEGIILVSNKAKVEIAQIYPKNLILGLGCRRGVEASKMEAFILRVLAEENLALQSLHKMASLTIKAEEEAMLAFSKKYALPFDVYTVEELQEVEHLFEGSDFVKAQIGVRAVSEPAAYLAGKKKGRFLVQKRREEGMTLSIFEEEM